MVPNVLISIVDDRDPFLRDWGFPQWNLFCQRRKGHWKRKYSNQANLCWINGAINLILQSNSSMIWTLATAIRLSELFVDFLFFLLLHFLLFTSLFCCLSSRINIVWKGVCCWPSRLHGFRFLTSPPAFIWLFFNFDFFFLLFFLSRFLLLLSYDEVQFKRENFPALGAPVVIALHCVITVSKWIFQQRQKKCKFLYKHIQFHCLLMNIIIMFRCEHQCIFF